VGCGAPRQRLAKLSPAEQDKDRKAVLAIPDYLDATRHKAVPV
jgi:hypothetical protein